MKKRKKKSNKRKGLDFEKEVEKSINSGALWFDKGDLHTKDYVIEIKFTEKKGFRITTKMLQKLWDEALDSNKLPLLVIGIKENDCQWKLTGQINREVK